MALKESNYNSVDTGFTLALMAGKIIAEDNFLSCDALKYIFVKEGKGRYLINGQKVELRCGDLLFLREGDSIEALTGQQPFEAYGVSFSRIHLESACEYIGSNMKEKLLYSKTCHKLHLSGYQFEDIRKRHDMLHLMMVRKENFNIRLKALLIQILTLFLTAGNEENRDSVTARLEELHNRMNNPESLEEGLPAMLKVTGFSHGHLCRIMKDTLGITPLKYLTDMRMEYAAKLLINTDIDTLTISLMLGYTSLSHFITLFGRHFGLSPSRYRQYCGSSGKRRITAI